MRKQIRCTAEVAKHGPYERCTDVAIWISIWGWCHCDEHKSPRDLPLSQLSDSVFDEVLAEKGEFKIDLPEKKTKVKVRPEPDIDEDGAYIVQQRDHVPQ